MAVTHTRPTSNDSTMNSYSSTVQTINANARPRDVRAIAESLDFLEAQLVKMIGYGPAVSNPLHEWTDERFGAITATVDGTGATSGATSLGVAAGHGDRIQLYDVLKTSSGELVWVTAIATDTLTIKRAHGGSTAAAITAASTLRLIGPAVPYNIAAPRAPHARGEFYTNRIQKFEYSTQIDDVQNNAKNSYLIRGKEYPNQIKKFTREAVRDLELTLIHGRMNTADADDPDAMNGFPRYITQNVAALSGAPLTLNGTNGLLTLLQQAWRDVGPTNVARTVLLDIFLKRVVSSWVDEMRRADALQSRFSVKLDTLDTDLGELQFLPHYHMPTDEIYVVNPKNLSILPFTGMTWHEAELPRSGSFQAGRVTGVYTLEATGDRAHAKITGISVTESDYPSLAA